jgi:hypothetical protein
MDFRTVLLWVLVKILGPDQSKIGMNPHKSKKRPNTGIGNRRLAEAFA